MLCSACLQGQKVRYDGASKAASIVPTLMQHITLQTICPEVEAGMTVPRPAVELVQHDNNIRVLGRDDKALDVSVVLQRQAERYIALIESNLSICGVVFKDRSPSCGLGSTPIFDLKGLPLQTGSGVIAARLRQRFPQLMLLEQTQLQTDADCILLAQAGAIACRFRQQQNAQNNKQLSKLVLTLAITIEKGQWTQVPALLGAVAELAPWQTA